jgi:hypothetical protein
MTDPNADPTVMDPNADPAAADDGGLSLDYGTADEAVPADPAEQDDTDPNADPGDDPNANPGDEDPKRKKKGKPWQ